MKILKNFFSRFPRTFNLLRIIYSMKLFVLTKNIQVSFCFSEVSVKFPHVSVQSWLDGKKKKKNFHVSIDSFDGSESSSREEG